MQAANTVSLPSSSILFSNADLVNCNSEKDGANVGSTGAKTTITFKLQNNTTGDYVLSMKSGAKDLEAVYNISIKNSSNTVVFNKDFNVSNTGSWTPTENHVMMISNLEAGSLTMVISVKSTTGSYAGNLGALSITSVADYDHIPGTITLSKGAYNGPKVENAGNVGYIKNKGTATYTVINNKEGAFNLLLDIYRYNQGSINITITDVETNKKEYETDYTIAADAPSSYTTNTIAIPANLKTGLKTISFTFSSNSTSYICNYKNVKLEYTETTPTLTSLSIDGKDILPSLDDNTYTYDITSYDDIPTVAATANEAGTAEVTQASADNGYKATVVLKNKNTGEIVETYTVTFNKLNIIEGKTFTWTTGDGATETLSDGTDYKSIRYSTVNPAFAIKSKGGNVYSDNRFKASEGAGNMWAFTIPSNAIVSKIEFLNCSENYYKYNGDETKDITTTFNVASEGATVITTDANGEVLKYLSTGQTITSTITNHQAGTPITFYADGGSQLAFSKAVIYYSITDNGKLSLLSQSIEDGATVEKNGSITFTFDNDIELTDGEAVKVNGEKVRTETKGSTITAYYWNLPYNSNNTITFAANSVKDAFGNKYDKDITLTVKVGEKPVVEKKGYDYVVGNANELDAAIKELQTTNNTANATRKTIFLKNGKYTYGTLTGSYQHNVSLNIDNWNNIYNVSLIGESKDGVLIEGTTDGITSSTFELGKGTGNYLQDLTIRNNYDFRAETLKDVSCAVTGGNKTILKNVAMQASQDTYVTGDRTYLEDCDIYGTTDFICGGGDIFFERCNLILGNKSGNVIVAPSTDATKKWGYVFQNNTIKADEGATNVADKNWNLGRPWQNEPRAYFLNTKMDVLCSDAGWTDMSKLTTHFYEYNSTDKDGKAIDLSTRKNSPTSLNQYSPVLTSEEAKEFTAHNVVGGTDAWDAPSYTQQTTKPELKYIDGKLTWKPMDDARCYAIFKNGEYVDNTTSCEYTADDITANWSVRAANEMGGLGEAAEAVAITAKLSDGGMGTFCSATSCKAPENLNVYTASVNDNTVTLDKVKDGIIPAGEGVVLGGEASMTYYMTPCEAQGKLEGNSLKGTLERTLIENDYSFVLVYDNTEDVSYFKNFQNGAYIPIGKAYLEIPTAVQGAQLKVVINNGGTNGINSFNANGNTEGAYFTISGQKTMKPQRGLYIHNGKKIIIK